MQISQAGHFVTIHENCRRNESRVREIERMRSHPRLNVAPFSVSLPIHLHSICGTTFAVCLRILSTPSGFVASADTKTTRTNTKRNSAHQDTKGRVRISAGRQATPKEPLRAVRHGKTPKRNRGRCRVSLRSASANAGRNVALHISLCFMERRIFRVNSRGPPKNLCSELVSG